MTPENQDQLLSQWLNDPTTGPPPGLEDEVVQAMIALRPELAPAPTITLDDILAGVTEGPFARRSEAPVSTISDEELEARRSEMPVSQAEIIDLASARKRRRRIWAGVGTMAAAALVLFTILPEQDQFAEAELKAPTAEQVLEERQTAPQEGVNPAKPAKELALEDIGTTSPPGAAPAPRPNAAKKSPQLKAEGNSSSYQPAPDDARGPAPETEPEPEESPARRDAEDAPADASPSIADLGFEDEEADYGEGSYDADDLDYEDQVQASESRTRSPTRGGSGGGLFGGRADNTNAPSAPVQESAKTTSVMSDDDFAYEEEPVEQADIPTDLDGLRAAARPWDYNDGWYLKTLQGSDMDDFAGAIDLAAARASEGDYAGAAEACRELASTSSDPRVRQDMYGRASVYAMSANDARTGQEVSSANTPYLARLYWAEGRALESSGDIEGARRAYTTAANLNAAR